MTANIQIYDERPHVLVPNSALRFQPDGAEATSTGKTRIGLG
jgi:hypothetical protein